MSSGQLVDSVMCMHTARFFRYWKSPIYSWALFKEQSVCSEPKVGGCSKAKIANYIGEHW